MSALFSLARFFLLRVAVDRGGAFMPPVYFPIFPQNLTWLFAAFSIFVHTNRNSVIGRNNYRQSITVVLLIDATSTIVSCPLCLFACCPIHLFRHLNHRYQSISLFPFLSFLSRSVFHISEKRGVSQTHNIGFISVSAARQILVQIHRDKTWDSPDAVVVEEAAVVAAEAVASAAEAEAAAEEVAAAVAALAVPAVVAPVTVAPLALSPNRSAPRRQWATRRLRLICPSTTSISKR